MPRLYAFRASSEDVVACSSGTSNFCTVASDSPSSPGHSEPLQLFLKRPIILPVTDPWPPPPDLPPRALPVPLPPLTEDTRRPDHEVANTIQQAFPAILGALCTAVSHALAGPPQPSSSATRKS